MKFGKEFVLQMLPEWKEAYIDYAYLKTLLKKALKSKLKKEHEKSPKTKVVRENTLYKAFSGLTHQLSDLNNNGDVEDQVIVVSTLRGDDDFNVCYETKFLNTSEELSDHDVMFFRSLDHEFNKVNKFYREKVEEIMKEAAMLNKQMDVLIALRIKVENPDFDDYSEITHLAADVANNPIKSTTSTPRSAKTSKMEHTIVIPEANISNERELEESTVGVVAGSKHTVNHSNVCEGNSNTNTRIPDALEILEHVKLNNTFETPRSTIKAVFKVSKAEELRYNKRELRKVEEQLKQVFIEFHCKLRLLKRYSYMNLLAISKVLKKYDKITSRGASKSYVKAVDTSYLGSSDEVTALLKEVETTFIKHFSSSDRRKGMKFLRPKAKKEKHRTTFFLGFFSGNAVALLVALVLIIKARDLMNNEGSTQYMENIFPLYSLFAYIILHMFMYAVNIFFWKRYRVNYTFIFGFKKGTELGYREVFLLSAGLALLALFGVLANLDMEMDPGTRSYKKITELVPLGLITFLLAVTFCPFNIIYRSSRLFFIKSMFRCMCTPLYKVTLPDFFLADQLTSQVQAIRNLEFYICYYGSGLYMQRRNNCRSSDVYNSFYFIVALLPYWCRLLQCLRRLLEEKDPNQGYNGLKYFLTIIAIVMRTSYDLKKGMKWKVLAAISSTIAAIMSTYWDIVMDWGLLQRRSKNRWLRDKLLISNTNVYFIAMVLNIILRLAWLQSVLNFHVSFLHKTALTTIVACLEILRRGMWNFFRLENEHLNNVGKFRAFKSVPLPFSYYDEEEEYSSSSSSSGTSTKEE